MAEESKVAGNNAELIQRMDLVRVDLCMRIDTSH